MATAGRHLRVVGNVTAGGVLSGSGSLTKAGAGTLTLITANTYSGPTTKLAGTISLNATATFGNGSGLLVLDGGELLCRNHRPGAPIAPPLLLTGSSTIAGDGTLTNSLRIVPFSSGSVTTPSGSLILRHRGTNAFSSNNVFRVRLAGGGFNFTRPLTVGFPGDLPSTLTQLELYNDQAAGDQTFSSSISGTGQILRDAPGPGAAAAASWSGRSGARARSHPAMALAH